jgi:hypothetical protein
MSNTPIPLYQWLALQLEGWSKVQKPTPEGKVSWSDMYERRIREALSNAFPSGSGFDAGTQLIPAEHINKAGKWNGKLTFIVSYHHLMDGFYAGWTYHKVTVRSDLTQGFSLTVSGRNRNQIKSYIAEIFTEILNQDVMRITDGPSADWHFHIDGQFLANADYAA